MRKRKSKLDRIGSLLQSQNIGAIPLSNEETAQLQRRWRRSFATGLDPSLSSESKGGYDWHAFSMGITRCEVGEVARQSYRAIEIHGPVYVIPHQDENAGYRIDTPNLNPDFSGKPVDAYIVPADFSWTMVYTHERDWYGPYFARVPGVSHGRQARRPASEDMRRRRKTRRG